MNADTYDLRDRLTPARHRAIRSFTERLENVLVMQEAVAAVRLRKGATVVSREHRLEYVVVEVTADTVTLKRKGVKLDPLMPFRGLTKVTMGQFEAHMEAVNG